MDTVAGTLSLLAPDGTRIPVQLDNYDPRTGSGTLSRITGMQVGVSSIKQEHSRPTRDNRGSAKHFGKSSAAASPPLLFPTKADCSEALTPAGSGYSATVQLAHGNLSSLQVSMFHNACVSEAWSCLRAPKANGAFEVISPKALAPAGFSSESSLVGFLDSHFKTSLASARRRSQLWAKEKATLAEQRKHLAKEAAVFFKLGSSAATKVTQNDTMKAVGSLDATRQARRSSRKRVREGDGPGKPDSSTPDSTQSLEADLTGPSKQARHSSEEVSNQGLVAGSQQSDTERVALSQSQSVDCQHAEIPGTGSQD